MKLHVLFFILFVLLFTSHTTYAQTQKPSVAYSSNTPILDRDLDGLTDDGEIQLYLTDPNNPDTDGDGIYDGVEVLQETNPLDHLSPVETAGVVEKPYAWFVTRSSAILAYLSLFVMVTFGLLMSTRLNLLMHPFIRAKLHCWLSWITLMFVGIHMTALLFDKYLTFSIYELLIPFGSRYAPLYVGLGVITMYLLLMIVITTRYLKKLPKKVWRLLHQSAFLAFTLVTIHGFFAGTDSGFWLLQVMYFTCGLTVGCLFLWRITKIIVTKC